MGKSTKKSASKVDSAPAVVSPSNKGNERVSSTSKTLFIGNLDSSVQGDDVKDFFKDVGEVDEVRLVMKNDKLEGSGQVEFTTAEAAQKALKLNNELLRDRPVKLDWLTEMADAAPPVTALSTIAMRKGKRDAVEVVENQVVANKKQRIGNGGVEQAIEEEKFETNNQTKIDKQEEINSISESEEEQKKNTRDAENPCRIGDGSEEDDRNGRSVEGGIYQPSESPKENNMQDAENPCRIGDGSEEDDRNARSVEGDIYQPSESPKENTTQDAEKACKTEDRAEEDGRDNRSAEDDDNQLSKSPKIIDTDVEMVDLPSVQKTPETGIKTLFMANLKYSVEERDVRNFFKDVGEVSSVRFAMKNNRFMGYCHVDFTTAEAAKEALKLNNALLLNRRVGLDYARGRGSSNPTVSPTTGPKSFTTERRSPTPITSASTVSKTLFIGNLNFSIEEDQVRDFFKDYGEIAEIRFVTRDDKFMGYGHVEFTTHEAAQKAIRLNGEILLDRRVKLDFAQERKEKSKTVYVRGFNVGDNFDNIRRFLEEHFGNCGEILKMSIPKDYDTGCPRGVAFIDFVDNIGSSKALELNGTEVKGGIITVEEAKKARGDSREVSGYGGRSGGRGGFSGGRDGGQGRWGRGYRR